MAKESVAKKVYVGSDGGERRSAGDNVDRLEFRFTDGTVRAVRPADYPESVRAAARWHGFAQKLGDSYNQSKGDVAKAIESFDEMSAQLMEGDWVTAAEGGGPRITQLATAIYRANLKAPKEEQSNIPDEAAALAIVARWDSDKRKAASEYPAIALELAELRLEAAKERVKTAKANAKESKPGLGGLLAA